MNTSETPKSVFEFGTLDYELIDLPCLKHVEEIDDNLNFILLDYPLIRNIWTLFDQEGDPATEVSIEEWREHYHSWLNKHYTVHREDHRNNHYAVTDEDFHNIKYTDKELRFYVYVYTDPTRQAKKRYGSYNFTHEPFYIGYGSGQRCYRHLREVLKGNIHGGNTHKKRRILNILESGKEPVIYLLASGMTEEVAKTFEIYIISKIGRRDKKTGPLTNMTDGGEGCSGAIHSEETRMKRSKTLKAKLYKLLSTELGKEAYSTMCKDGWVTRKQNPKFTTEEYKAARKDRSRHGQIDRHANMNAKDKEEYSIMCSNAQKNMTPEKKKSKQKNCISGWARRREMYGPTGRSK